MTIKHDPEMRICRWCGFVFEGPMRRLTACPHCEAEDDGRARFSISASNATDKDLLAAIPHLIQAMGAMSKEIAALKASRT